MTQQSFRGVLAAAIVVVLVAGLYLGWHFTHQPESACPAWQPGQAYHPCP